MPIYGVIRVVEGEMRLKPAELLRERLPQGYCTVVSTVSRARFQKYRRFSLGSHLQQSRLPQKSIQ